MIHLLKICKNLFIIAVLCQVFFSCKEDPIGQMPLDKTPPKPISNPVVTNVPGGAKIKYQLPDETDLLYVKAVFTLPNGTEQEVKTSVFFNTLEISGFGKSSKMTIPLITVDRSRNESEPVYVEIEPEDSPIYDICKSIEIVQGFGGFKINWFNPMKTEVMIDILKKDEDGVFKYVETFYSSEPVANRAVRGQDPVESEYAVFVRDYYKNHTDTIYSTLTPWYEVQLDKSKFAALPKSSKFNLHSYGSSSMSIIWNDAIMPENAIYYIADDQTPKLYWPYFAFDMGVKAKLSRFRFWSRGNAFIYSLHAPKEILLLGTNDWNVASNPESDDSEWQILIRCTSYRPSGLPPEEPPTDEDRAYHDAGQEFEFPLDAPAVRYVRFKSLGSWSGSYGLFVSELTFWGSPEN